MPTSHPKPPSSHASNTQSGLAGLLVAVDPPATHLGAGGTSFADGALRWSARALAGVALAGLLGCGQSKGAANIEALPVPEPDLPEVPKLPAAPHPITYPDGSFSLYGLHRQMDRHIGKPVAVTAFIAGHYVPPECKGKDCEKPAKPHLWLADTAGEADSNKRLTVVGYSEYNDEARRRGLGALPEGQRVRVQGTFTQVSASGFNASNGLIEYESHESITTR